MRPKRDLKTTSYGIWRIDRLSYHGNKENLLF